jgi:hypothetical protein
MKFTNARGGDGTLWRAGGEFQDGWRVGGHVAYLPGLGRAEASCSSSSHLGEGDKVVFGPKVEDNYIENLATRRRIQMVMQGSSYMAPAEPIMQEAGFMWQAW